MTEPQIRIRLTEVGCWRGLRRVGGRIEQASKKKKKTKFMDRDNSVVIARGLGWRGWR